ncbi:MAG: TraR/DksA family transcriptional regulator [Streptosporangiaceae bacterium]
MDVADARKRLEEVRDELDRSVAVLGRSDQRREHGADYPQDSADIGTNLAETDRSDAILEAAQNRRVLVLDALRRLDEGRYGVCVDCGKPVPESRLKARPEAARCLKCQAAWDHARR